MNVAAMPEAIARAQAEAAGGLPPILVERFGANALEIVKIARETGLTEASSPDGFPWLAAQLRYSIRHEMVERLEDFYLRRVPLYASRADHGLPWAEALSHVWAAELGRDDTARVAELAALRGELDRRSAWKSGL
jgi:glycerol-3-phosphate dehydrogenase